MVKVGQIIQSLEQIAPRSYQESYDNSGLITGNGSEVVSGILISLDCIEEVVDEAIEKNCNLIIAHHPIVFKGIKQFNGKNYVERTVIKAIKNDICIYAIHTNLDNVSEGVNAKFAELLGLQNIRILSPKKGSLTKLESFVPLAQKEEVLDALYQAGAGNIGNYSECSFSHEGTGTFMPNQAANPSIGSANTREKVEEAKIEVVFPAHLKGKIVSALKSSHPYEEVAYYLFSIDNENQEVGSGMIGELEQEMSTEEFLNYLKRQMKISTIKYTSLNSNKIKKVALCGGAGSFLLGTAKSQGADAFISSDFKYHEFFDGEGKIMIADIGHYESEIATKALIHGFISEKFPNIASYLSEVNTNPVKYF